MTTVKWESSEPGCELSSIKTRESNLGCNETYREIYNKGAKLTPGTDVFVKDSRDSDWLPAKLVDFRDEV